MSDLTQELETERESLVKELAEDTQAIDDAPKEDTEVVEPKVDADDADVDKDEDDSDSEENDADEDEKESDEKKPIWKSKNKVSAKTRISQLTKARREAEAKTEALQARLDDLEKLVVGEQKEKNRDDFVDDKEFEAHQREQLKAEATKEVYAKIQAEQKQEAIGQVFNANLAKAKEVYPDIENTLENFNTRIPMNTKVREDLLSTEAGLYTMARIADDAELNDKLGRVSEAEAKQVMVGIYTEIKQSLSGQEAQTNVVKPSIPKPPKKVKSIGNDDLMNMDDDDFMKNYNKKFYG